MLQATKSLSQEELIQQCKKGKSKAQKELYEKYASLMLGLCSRYIKEVAEAEDVMIKAFLKIFKNIAQYEGKGSFEGWMRRIMVNESLMYIRKNKAMYVEVDIDYATREPNYNWAEESLDTEVLYKMIEALPIGYKTVFNLYAIEGFSHKEIAEKLEINENTSKSQLSRARALLQKQILKLEESTKEANHEG